MPLRSLRSLDQNEDLLENRSKSLGIRLGLTTTQASVRRVREELVEHEGLAVRIKPLLAVLESLNEQIAGFDGMIAKAVEENCPQARKLRVIGGVGPIMALCFVLSIEDPRRFEDARDVGVYLGLVPRWDQSGNTDKQLPISKAGTGYLRRLLVQFAQHMLVPLSPSPNAYASTIPLFTKAYNKPPTLDFSTTPDKKAKQVSV